MVVGVRRLDVAASSRGKRFTFAPLMILEGPNEPPTMKYILANLVQFFRDHSPGANYLPWVCGCVMHGPYANVPYSADAAAAGTQSGAACGT